MQKHQESQLLPASTLVQRSSRSDLSSTSSCSALSSLPPPSLVFTPPIYITDVTLSPSKSSSSRKSKKRFPDFRWGHLELQCIHHILHFKVVTLVKYTKTALLQNNFDIENLVSLLFYFFFSSGLRKSLSKRKSEKHSRRSFNRFVTPYSFY